MHHPLVSWLAASFFAVVLGAAETPQTILSAGTTTLTIALPDAEHGYYRGPRFNWGGMVVQAQWNGHTLFTALKQPHDPVIHDHGAGACDEFGIDGALGYDTAMVGDAATGGEFLKIGVGALRRTREQPYFFGHPYPISRPGTWTVENVTDAVNLTQEFHLDAQWGYRYTKQIRVRSDGFIIANQLDNLGTQTITTDHYNHHMFAVDALPIDGSWSVHFNWDLAAKAPAPTFSMDPRVFTLTGPLTKTLWTDFSWVTPPPSTQLSLQHGLSRTAIDMSTDAPPARMAVYAEPQAICPEPFTAIHITPGQTQTWTTTYTFRTLP